MPVTNTYSQRTALAAIEAALSPLANLATEASIINIAPVLEEQMDELRKIRRGQELALGVEIEEVED